MPEGSPESQRIATPPRTLIFGMRILGSGYTQAPDERDATKPSCISSNRTSPTPETP
jgi:hypothetical protein